MNRIVEVAKAWLKTEHEFAAKYNFTNGEVVGLVEALVKEIEILEEAINADMHTV